MAVEMTSNVDDNEIKFEFPNAYLKVSDVEIRVLKNEAWLRINIFASKEARDTVGACSIKKITEKVSLDELNPIGITKDKLITAAYEWVKKQPQFDGIDV